jgi:predicted permease
METLLRELRYGLRTLIKSPGFTIVAAVMLALGIGSSTAIFSVVNAVLLRVLPYPEPQKIMRVSERSPSGRAMRFADPNFDDFRDQNDTFAALAIYNQALTSVSGGSEPVRVNVGEVSSGFFKALGVSPAIGRAFVPDEQRLHGSPAAIVSHGFWQRYLGGERDLSKFHLAAEELVLSVVGVMPEGFDFPLGNSVWIPRELYPELPSRTAHNWRAIGRLRDGVAITQARANLGGIARRIKTQYGKDVDLVDAVVVPLADDLVKDVRTALLTLSGAVGLLLLVACANVAGLLVARTSARRKELAVRTALGAGRGRLMQQFLAESFWLSLAGGGLGILIASSAVRLLPAILPANLPRQEGVAVDTTVLLFALAATAAVAVALGLAAAWRAGSGDLQQALTAGSRSYSGAGHRLRSFLVAGEIATTLVILVGAGLLGRSFLRLLSTSPGFRQDNLITMEFSIPSHQWGTGTGLPDAARNIRMLDEVVARLRSTPGAESVGVAGAMPVAAGDDLAEGTFVVLDSAITPTDIPAMLQMAHDPARAGHASYCLAGEAYFRTLGIPLIRGRMFGDQDVENSPHVAIVSESLARRRWPGEDPLGKIIEFGNMDGNLKPLTIVGIAGDVRAAGLDLPPSSVVYVNYRQRGLNPNAAPTILVRSAAPVGNIVSAARAIFHDLVPDAPVRFSTFEAEMGGWLADRRFLLLLVGAFAAAALTLAAVGIYGVVAFSAARRTQEIGIRMAVGAQRGDVLRLILGEGAKLALTGLAVGVAASLAITRLLSSLLFGISATDPLTFVLVAALLCAVALVASYIPARRAMRLDPNTALHYE